MKLCECGCGQKTNLATRTDKKRGLVKGQPYRFIAHHALRLHLGKGHRSHGESNSIEYRVYGHAKQRCTNPNVKDYSLYGGRGIEFRFESFSDFLLALGRRPSPQYSLDRYPDNNGHYEVGNVRWATPKQQYENRRLKKLEDFTDAQIRKEVLRRKLTPFFIFELEK